MDKWTLWECTRVKGCGPRLIRPPWAKNMKESHCWNCHSQMNMVRETDSFQQLIDPEKAE